MRVYWRVAFAALVLLPGQALTTDPPGAAVRQAKEPKYRSTPRYCSLAFGPAANEQFLVVLDGTDLYLDRNANGDLTETGEILVARPRSLNQAVDALWYGKQHDRVFDVKLRGGTDGTSVQKCILTLPPTGQYLTAECQGKVTQFATGRFGTDRNKAPVINFDGPLQMQLHYLMRLGERFVTPTFYRDNSLMVLAARVETSGEGTLSPGSLILHESRDGDQSRSSVLAADLHPVADIEFPNQDAAKAPIKITLELKDRFSGYQFLGMMRVPHEAGVGKARVTLSFPAWRDGAVIPIIMEVPVVDAGE